MAAMKTPFVLWIFEFCLFSVILFSNYSWAIEVGKHGHYFKGYYSLFRNDSYFDSQRNRMKFDYNGKGKFMSFVIDYRYGITNHLNAGIILPWVSNRFENDFDVFMRDRISDLTLLAEYRFFNFPTAPRVLSLRVGVITPTGYETNHPSWIGNGTTEVLFGLIFKQFIRGERFDPFWYEIDVAVRSPIDENDGNIDGNWSIPIHLGFNYRPSFDWTFSGGLIASLNDRRDFIGIEGLIKYRMSFPIELELGITHMVAGKNSSAGTALLVGLLINTARIWHEEQI